MQLNQMKRNQHRHINLSKSGRLLDWSDKLKYMEMQDVLDIDINHVTEELERKSQRELQDKVLNPLDDSFTQYLERLNVETDNKHSKGNEESYDLDQLRSYQSCFIENKNESSQPHQDLLSHFDYLDEGVLIQNDPKDERNQHSASPIKRAKQSNIETENLMKKLHDACNNQTNISTTKHIRDGNRSPFSKILEKHVLADIPVEEITLKNEQWIDS